MAMIKVRINGLTAILMHNGRLANPLDEHTKHLKKLTSKPSSKRTDEDYIECLRAEWMGSLYIDETGPFIPADNLDACIKGGAKLSKLGKRFGSAVQVHDDRVYIDYPGPRDADGLWAAGFRDISGVKVGQARVMRCRPIFREWAAAFEVNFDPSSVDRDQVVTAIAGAGKDVGLFDRRPEKGGRFGKFSVEVL